MQHGRHQHGESGDDPVDPDSATPKPHDSDSTTPSVHKQQPQFGGPEKPDDKPPPSNWHISRSYTLNVTTNEAVKEWDESRQALLAEVQRLFQERELHPQLRWRTDEIEARESCCSRLLMFDEDFFQDFKDTPWVRFHRAKIMLDLARLLGQLALAYRVNTEPAMEDDTWTRMRSVTVLGYRLLKSVSQPSVWERMTALLSGKGRPTRDEIQRVQQSLRGVYRMLQDVRPRRAGTPPKRRRIFTLEDSVAEVVQGTRGNAPSLTRFYTGRLAQVYAIQADVGAKREALPRTFAYLKTLEAWFAYALANASLRAGDQTPARNHGAVASAALELALIPDGLLPRAGPELVDGTELPSWSEIRMAQRRLMPLLADLRLRLR